MTTNRRRRQPAFDVSEIAGRLLHERYHQDAQDFVLGLVGEEIPSPTFPDHAETDTGTLRAVVVAS